MATTPPTQNRPLADRATGSANRPAWLVTLLCWLIVVFDGYDLIVYGTTLPRLLKEKGWDLTPTTAGFIGSLAFAGMLVGALGAGLLSDRLGRRRTILWATLWFSAFTARARRTGARRTSSTTPSPTRARRSGPGCRSCGATAGGGCSTASPSRRG
ncbi:MFS transporter [Terrabacter sp. C0L_2]|uniref:MFS transporter n=1 Tax=Terrabacter sp. C0L_2 TaxID=3108389 RepID=UPI002ED5E1BF|nr:MFS transporter [Terrabacter sp. C0L_2]